MRLHILVLGCLVLSAGCNRLSESDNATGNLASSQVVPQPPFEPQPFSVFRPFFFTNYGDHSISEIVGTGFLVDPGSGGEAVLVTALHLLSPETGLTENVAPGTLEDVVTEVVVSEAFGASDSTILFAMPVNHPLTQVDTAYWEQLDLVAVRPREVQKRFHPLSLSTEPPKQGDRVWLSMAAFGGASASQAAHAGEIVANDQGKLVYRMDNPELSLFAADGAPLLDARGRVIGMHLRSAASGPDDDSMTGVMGVGVDVNRLREGLDLLGLRPNAEPAIAEP